MGLDNMKRRMTYVAGSPSEDSNVREKYLSFKSALEDPYQSETITLNGTQYKCLINPDKLKEQYDQKEISIPFDAGMKAGDTFYWDRTDSYWIVYLQENTEEAYFRATIRKCNYQIEANGNKYWIYLRGPVETALVWNQKHQIQFNDMNYSLLFYITKNKDTLDYFSRLNVVKFDNHNWRVAATDKYSLEGVIEVYLEEYFDNSMEDAMIEPEIEEIDTITTPIYIDGPQIVKPYDTNVSYSIAGLSNGEFVVNSSKVKIINSSKTSCILDITTGKSGQFTISYKEDSQIVNLDVLIKSL